MSPTADHQSLHLAVDFGASSGRVIAGTFNGATLEIEEAHRFLNEPVRRGETLTWDFDTLVHEMMTGLRHGHDIADARAQHVATIGVDTWGVDFGLLDEAGELMGPPVHYRDDRTKGMMEAVFAEDCPADDIFAATGIQFMVLNSLYQLAALRRQSPSTLAHARQLLMMPDLFHRHLTGSMVGETTNASTTQLFDPLAGDWCDTLIARLQLPRAIFPRLVQPGTSLGPLTSDIASRLGGSTASVIAVGTHDTASAVAAVPAASERFAYLSCGTWSLLGTETNEPIMTPAARALNVTNEGGVGGKIRLLKNIMGLWLLQETRSQWEREGQRLGWAALVRLTDEAPPFTSLVDPDDPCFFAPGDMPSRLREWCRTAGHTVPETHGAVVRCILESLALKYAVVLGQLEQLLGVRLPTIHMVGGGVQNELLCQFTANATGRTVIAGPIEATAIGNLGVQLIGAGRLRDLDALRAMVRASFAPKTYQPTDGEAWRAARLRFADLLAARSDQS